MTQVIGLKGGSGTGKSHRASLVAVELGCDAIIDDGLLLGDGKILAGVSAKRAGSKMQAIRRAIFTEPGHAEDVREALNRLAPQKLLILGTSLSMIERICERLELPQPSAVLDITELARPEQIRHARRIRAQLGRHVIPAPMVEVRKTFSGYMVDPLRFILRRSQDPSEEVIIEKSVVRPTWSYLGKFTVEDTVLSSIAAHAAQEVPGVARTRRVTVESWAHGVVLHIELEVYFGTRLPAMMQGVQRHVSETVELMTAQNVLRVLVVSKKMVLPPKSGSVRETVTP